MPGLVTLVVVLLIALLVAAIAGGWTAYRHTQYANRPEYRWARDVLSYESQLQGKCRSLLANVRAAAGEYATGIGKVWSKATAEAWGSLSVDSLAQEDNIGPGTVDKLKSAGIQTVQAAGNHSQLQSIDGIGPVRAGLIRSAVAVCRKKVYESLPKADQGPGYEARRQVEGLKVALEDSTETKLRDLWSSQSQLMDLLPVSELARWYRRQVLLSFREPPVLPHGLVPFEPPTGSKKAPPTPAKPQVVAPTPVPSPVQPPAPPPAISTPHVLSKREQFDLVVRVAVATAYADGNFAKSEEQILMDQLHQQFGKDPDLQPLIADCARAAGKPRMNDLWADLECLGMDQRRQLYRLCCRIADAAGSRNTKEVQFLEELQRGLGLTAQPSAGNPISPSSQNSEMDPESARIYLEIDPLSPLSIDLVRRQHRMLLERMAVVRPNTLGSEIEAMLGIRKERLLSAATILAKHLGEPLEPPTAPANATSSDPRYNPDLDAALGL